MVAQFSLTPGQSFTGVIDYYDPEGRKLWENSIWKLWEEQFTCDSEDIFLFLNTLKECGDNMGWTITTVSIMYIPEDPLDPNSDMTNIITNHSELTLEEIRAFKEMYITIHSKVV